MKLIYALPLFLSLSIMGCNNETTPEKTATPEKNATPKKAATPETVSSAEQPYVSPLNDDAPTYKISMMQYAPYMMRNQLREPEGYDVDLIRAIGEESGFKPEINDVEFSELFTGVKSGTAHLAMSGLSLIPERLEVMSPTKPYLTTTPGYLVKKDSVFKSNEDLLDKKIAVLENSSVYTMLKKQGATNLISKQTVFGSIQAVFTDEADAVAAFQASLLFTAAQFSEHPSRFIPISDPINTVAWGNLENTEAIDKFNEGFDKVVANGRYQKINEKWFGDNAEKMMVK